MNMNVLVDGVMPRVVSLAEALQQWLDHRRDVLLRRSRHRLAAIERRLEMLAGMLVVFLNLDAVIRIIREEDEPKETLKARFALTDAQVNYVLDTRLRALRRLEEMALQKEQDELLKEKREIETLLGDEKQQWQTIASQIRDIKKKYGPETHARQAAHVVRSGARRRRRRSRRGDDRARAGDRAGFAEGLDSRAERPCRRPLGGSRSRATTR